MQEFNKTEEEDAEKGEHNKNISDELGIRRKLATFMEIVDENYFYLEPWRSERSREKAQAEGRLFHRLQVMILNSTKISLGT